MVSRRWRALAFLFALVALSGTFAGAQGKITTPRPSVPERHHPAVRARDSHMVNLAETWNMNRVMFREWSPQIMHKHRQTGPAGTVEFMPPFGDPFNCNSDPLVPMGIELVGAAMHSRFVQEG